MNKKYLYDLWKQEEDSAHIHGWDFSHIDGRFKEEHDLPWDYEKIVRHYLSFCERIMDYDTGGAEFLLSLGHPYSLTSATEGYKPNVALCRERLLPLGVDFRECSTPEKIPFDNESFDLIINRHGGFVPNEIRRLLKNEGIFVTEQVGCNNNRDLIEMVLPDTPVMYPDLKLLVQKKAFEDNGFQIVTADETYRPIEFYDVGAFVWFARIIKWEFPDFSVDRCFERLLKMQENIDKYGKIQGTIHRYLIVARK